MKRLALLLLFSIAQVLITGLASCERCSSSLFRYRIDSYEPQLQRNIRVLPIKPLAEGDTVSAREVELALVGKIYALASHQSTGGGGGSAFACSPATEPLDKLSDIQLVSDHSFSADLPAGSNLASVFVVGTVNDQLRRPLTDFLKSKTEPAQDYVVLSLLKSPDRTDRHRFIIRVELTSGRILTDTTTSIVLKP